MHSPVTGELPLEVVGGEASFAGDGVLDRVGVVASRKKLNSFSERKERRELFSWPRITTTLALGWLTDGNGDRQGECDGDGVLAGIGDEGAEQWSRIDGDRSGEADPSARPGYRKADEKRRWRTLLPPVFASPGDSPAGSFRDGMSSF